MFTFILLFNFITIGFIVPITIDYFPEVEGFVKNGAVEIYKADDLFDYINGAADSYLNYDFKELHLQRYKGSNGQSLKIEIYQHSIPATAFGIYSSEKTSNASLLSIGSEGYYEQDILNFYIGNYYIKLVSYRIENDYDLMMRLATLLSDILGRSTKGLDFFSTFPKEGRLENSEQYIHKRFLGYDSFSEAFTLDYKIENEYFKIFQIEKPSVKVCSLMLVNYFKSIDLDSSLINEREMEITDPYQGKIYFIWSENTIMGAYDYSDLKEPKSYLNIMKKSLKIN